jgi:hypothetical protein
MTLSFFFTSPDNDLLRGESTRDPLGLLPIWSKIGHQLIPGLASTVSRIDGVQGVLFLYTSLNSLSQEIRSKKADSKILLFLERLWEYHLYIYRQKNPCFGINRLNGADFQLNFNGSGTVGTGLRQYYRGTCNNKGILANDLITLNQPWQGICQRLLDPTLITWLEKQIKLVDSDEYSISARSAYEQLEASLVRFSKGNAELWRGLEKALITDAQQKRWIEHVVKNMPDWKESERSPRDLVESIQDYARSQNDCEDWRMMCQNILDCEPFLQVLESAFAVLQESGRTTVRKISDRFAQSAPSDLADVCQCFTQINLPLPSKRLQSLQVMARKLEKKEYRKFVGDLLLTYYPMICNERGKSPVVRLDGDIVIAMSPHGGQLNWSESSQNWNNGYFIKTQISLYTDLQSRMSDAHD